MNKRTTKAKNAKKKKKNPLSEEIVGITIVGISMLVIVSLFTANVGLLGEIIKNGFVGLLGIAGYIVPLFALVLGGIYIKGDLKLFYKLLELSLPFLLLFVTVSHVMHYGAYSENTLWSTDYMKQAAYYNGGWLGALIGELSLGLIGLYGTYIAIIVLLGIWILITTQFPLFTWMSKQFVLLLHSISVKIKGIQEAIREKRRLSKLNKQVEEEQSVYEEVKREEHPPIKITIDEETGVVYEGVEEVKINVADEIAITTPTTEQMTLEETMQPSVEISNQSTKEDVPYSYPDIELLSEATIATSNKANTRESLVNAQKLEETLKSFGVEAKVLQIHRGPTVTRYELQPKQGVKVSKIVNLADDIALNLAASGIRIEAPIPGKSAVGIEVPNEKSEMVYLKEVIQSDSFTTFSSKLAFALGKDIAGKAVVADIAKMPHLLIAGATGSGKSVCINTLITGILYKAKPEEVKLIMIDPKVVELNVYNGIPHLLIPVVTDPKKAAGALNWAVKEMTDRYNQFAAANVRDMTGFNRKNTDPDKHMPNIIIIIDELADLMMTAAKEVEDAICRLAQMARAAGIHLVIATQRPSVDVITGVIKANIPSRLAFAVSSGTDSRTILDMNGAEKLLGKGDMLFNPIGESKPIRIQGAFISDKEVENIVEAIKETEGPADYKEEVMEQIETPAALEEDENEDEFLQQAIELAKTKEKISISMLQRYFRIGFNRASRLMDALEKRGIVGPDEGSKPRKVLTREENQDV